MRQRRFHDSPYGSRTRLCTVKGCRPKPIDERALIRRLIAPRTFRTFCYTADLRAAISATILQIAVTGFEPVFEP
jgi:hypothetical protein